MFQKSSWGTNTIFFRKDLAVLKTVGDSEILRRSVFTIPPICTIGDKNITYLTFVWVGMNGDTFSIEAPQECSKKFAATWKGTSLPEEMFLEYPFCS